MGFSVWQNHGYYVNLFKIKLIIDGQKFVLQSGINLNCKKQLSILKIQS